MKDGESLHDARYAPPRSHVEDVAQPERATTLATRLQRFWAAMVDLGAALAVGLLVAFLSPFDPWGEGRGENFWAIDPVSALVDFGVFLVLNGVLLVQRGQTLGKAALRIRIVRSDGGPSTPTALLAVRYGLGYLLMVVPAVGLAYVVVDTLLIFRKSRRCLHDVLANTIVVKA